MKIYTSYFAAYNKWGDALPLGITRFKPSYWNGINLESLAPSADLLREYKNKQIDEYMFKIRYLRELKDRNLDSIKIRNILE